MWGYAHTARYVFHLREIEYIKGHVYVTGFIKGNKELYTPVLHTVRRDGSHGGSGVIKVNPALRVRELADDIGQGYAFDLKEGFTESIALR